MTHLELEYIRKELGVTRPAMAALLQCDYVGYKRYALGTRPVPRYIARGCLAALFIHGIGLLDEYVDFLQNRTPVSDEQELKSRARESQKSNTSAKFRA